MLKVKNTEMDVLGIDVGGSYIKGALVDIQTGELTSESLQLETPQPATPEAVVEVICKLVNLFDWHGLMGCGFPAVIQAGVAKTAANIDPLWIGIDVQKRLQQATGCPSFVINDADAAGLAEMQFGKGVGRGGTVLVLTLGTGIGSALFSQGELVPNLELGCLPINGAPAEHYAAAAVRSRENLSWQSWAKRLNLFLNHVEGLFSPELIIIGGGISCEYKTFFPQLKIESDLLPAHFFNQAGIVGAACFAAEKSHA